MTQGIDTRRLLTIAGVLAVAASLTGFKVSQLQLFDHNRYLQLATDEHWGTTTIEPHRGSVRDRFGNPLVTTVTTYRIVSDGKLIPPSRVGRTANLLSPILGYRPDAIAAALVVTTSRQILADVLPFEKGEKIVSLGLPGIQAERQNRRTYPEGNLAAALLGILGRDQHGLSGLELDYDRQLGGRAGKITYERDTTGAEIPLGFRDEKPAEEGADLVLTIDRYIQRLADQEAEAATVRHKADAVTILVMEPSTGAILAMATRPSFDVTRPILTDKSQIDLVRNRAVTDMYEPGSIFKIITMASALEDKKVVPSTTFVDKGWVTKYGREIVNWDGAANGVTSMTKLLVKSSNVGAVWVSDLLGPERQYHYIREFGFGQPTNIDLSGEATGQLRDQNSSSWSPFDAATNSFGQGINVTPIQMITAVSAIANGGKLMQPFVVRQVLGPDGVRNFEPVVVRRVISTETARTLATMMIDVVNEGTAKAVIPGYRLSGKSGTTQIGTGQGYSDDQTIASMTVFPTDNPPFVVLVRVDRPKDNQWGGQVAAPIAKLITEKLLAYYRIPPNDPKAKPQ